MLGQVNELCSAANIWATGHPSNRSRRATETETSQALTRIVKPNLAEALERGVISWDSKSVPRVDHGGWEMLGVIDIVAGLDPRIHLNQSIGDGIAITALGGRRLGRYLIVFVLDNVQAVLVVKDSAFATQWLIEVAFEEHAVADDERPGGFNARCKFVYM